MISIVLHNPTLLERQRSRPGFGGFLELLVLLALLPLLFSDAAAAPTNAPAQTGASFIYGTHFGDIIDAPITIAGTDKGAGTIPGMVVQLYWVQGNKMYPVGKPRTFVGDEGRKAMHLLGEETIIVGTQAGQKVTLRLRAYNGKTFETSEYQGESADFECTLAGGLSLPNYPVRLKPFTVKKRS